MNKMNRKYISLYRQLNIYFDMKKKFVVVYFVKKSLATQLIIIIIIIINSIYIFFKNK